jgi:hypothetical protein
MSSSDLRGRKDGQGLLRTEFPNLEAYGLLYVIHVCSS